MMKKMIAGITFAVGTAAILVKLNKYIEQQGEPYFLPDFQELVSNQKTVDELNTVEILEWIREIKKSSPEELIYILAYPTKEIVEKYRIANVPGTVDVKHNLLLLAVRKRNYRPVNMHLISFGTMDPELERTLFHGEECAVVEE